MDVSGQPHALTALPTGGEHPVPIELDSSMCPTAGMDVVEKR